MRFPFTAKEVVIGIAGVAIGVTAGYFLAKKKYKEMLDDEVEQLSENCPEEVEPESDEDEEDNGDYIDEESYENYVNAVQKNDCQVKEETEAEDEDDESKPDILPDGTYVFHDGDFDMEIKREPPKKHRKPKVLGAEKKDPDDPSTDFMASNLYYFMDDKSLTNRWGTEVDEEETIGPNPRRYGFMNGQGKADMMWIRNYDKERDFLLQRKSGSALDFFDTSSNGPGEEDEEETIE